MPTRSEEPPPLFFKRLHAQAEAAPEHPGLRPSAPGHRHRRPQCQLLQGHHRASAQSELDLGRPPGGAGALLSSPHRRHQRRQRRSPRGDALRRGQGHAGFHRHHPGHRPGQRDRRERRDGLRQPAASPARSGTSSWIPRAGPAAAVAGAAWRSMPPPPGLRLTVAGTPGCQRGPPAPSADLDFEDLTAQRIFEAAQEGDPVALESFELTGRSPGPEAGGCRGLHEPGSHLPVRRTDRLGRAALRADDGAPWKGTCSTSTEGTVKLLPSGIPEGLAAILGASALIWKELSAQKGMIFQVSRMLLVGPVLQDEGEPFVELVPGVVRAGMNHAEPQVGALFAQDEGGLHTTHHACLGQR